VRNRRIASQYAMAKENTLRSPALQPQGRALTAHRRHTRTFASSATAAVGSRVVPGRRVPSIEGRAAGSACCTPSPRPSAFSQGLSSPKWRDLHQTVSGKSGAVHFAQAAANLKDGPWRGPDTSGRRTIASTERRMPIASAAVERHVSRNRGERFDTKTGSPDTQFGLDLREHAVISYSANHARSEVWAIRHCKTHPRKPR